MKPNLLLLLLTPLFASFACAQKWELKPKRQPTLFLVPNGYVGWLHVEYGIKGAPALPVQKGFIVYKFPHKGTIRTSSPLLFGWAKDKTYYTTPQGWRELTETENEGNGMIWGSFVSGGDMKVGDSKGHMKIISIPRTEDVFIGTWKQFSATKSKPPTSKEEQKILESSS